MNIQIIPKQTDIPAFDAKAVKIRRMEYFDPPYRKYGEEEITEELITEALKRISGGVNLYLFLDPGGEQDWLEVNSDGEWIALGFSGDCGQNNYYAYNPEFAGTADRIGEVDFSDEDIYTNLESGGQSPIPKIQALTDMAAGIRAVEYFIRTGGIYPGIDWLHES